MASALSSCITVTSRRMPAAADLLVVSAFAADYTPVPTTLIGSLKQRCSISVADLAQRPQFDLRDCFSLWISAELDNCHFRRVMGVEIVGSHVEPAEAMENVFVGLSMLEAKGIKIQSVALPLLGAGLQRVDPSRVMEPMLRAARSALERSSCLSRVLFVDIDEGRVAALNAAMDTALRRIHVTLPKTELITSLRADIVRALDAVNDQLSDGHGQLGLELRRVLGQSQPQSFEVGLLGRRLAELIADDLLKKAKTSPDLMKKIEELGELGVAPWIRGYLHTLRVLGNESAHEKSAIGRVPQALSEDDLTVCLFCVQRVLNFWAEHRGAFAAKRVV